MGSTGAIIGGGLIAANRLQIVPATNDAVFRLNQLERDSAGLGLTIWRAQLPKAGIPNLTLPWSLSSDNSVRYCEACLPDDGAPHAGSKFPPSASKRTRALASALPHRHRV
jgi:hypothetical protein